MVCTTWVNSMLWNVSELHWNVSDLQLRTAVNSSYLFHCQHLYILYNVLYIFVRLFCVCFVKINEIVGKQVTSQFSSQPKFIWFIWITNIVLS